MSKAHTLGDKFRLFLHENMLAFFRDIDHVVTAAEYMSDADLMEDWQVRARA